MAEDKFELVGNTLTVLSPLDLYSEEREGEGFVENVDALVASASGKNIAIDLQRLGSLDSTTIALAIVAARKASDANKHLTIRVSKRNQTGITFSGLGNLCTVQLL